MAQAKREAMKGVVRAETIILGRNLIDIMEERLVRDIRSNDEFWSRLTTSARCAASVNSGRTCKCSNGKTPLFTSGR